MPAKVAVHRGVFSEVLREVISESKIDTVVLGSSPQESGIVSYEHLEALSTRLSNELDVEFIVVQDRITSYNVCYTKLLRAGGVRRNDRGG